MQDWYKRQGFNPWVRKIPWKRPWQSTPVFLPGESPWTEEPDGLQSMGSQRVGHDWATYVVVIVFITWRCGYSMGYIWTEQLWETETSHFLGVFKGMQNTISLKCLNAGHSKNRDGPDSFLGWRTQRHGRNKPVNRMTSSRFWVWLDPGSNRGF